MQPRTHPKPHLSTVYRRTAATVGVAVGVGALLAYVKGPAADPALLTTQFRSAIGNLSAPWLLIAAFAGMRAANFVGAAALGLAATAAALVTFYAMTTHLMGAEAGGVVYQLTQNRAYLEAGVVTGPLLGVSGWWLSRRIRLAAALISGVALAAEPVVLSVMGAVFSRVADQASRLIPLVVRIIPGWGITPDTSPVTLSAYAVEAAVGLALIAYVMFRRREMTPAR